MENSKSNRKTIVLLSVLADIAYLYLISIDFINLSGAEWLFMGLITLLIANILKRSVEYKEEQDLTI